MIPVLLLAWRHFVVEALAKPYRMPEGDYVSCRQHRRTPDLPEQCLAVSNTLRLGYASKTKRMTFRLRYSSECGYAFELLCLSCGADELLSPLSSSRGGHLMLQEKRRFIGEDFNVFPIPDRPNEYSIRAAGNSGRFWAVGRIKRWVRLRKKFGDAFKFYPVTPNNAAQRAASFSTGQELPCPICLDPATEENPIILDGCGHRYCQPCFQNHVQNDLESKNLPYRCAHENCRKIVTPAAMNQALGSTAQAAVTYSALMVRQDLEQDPSVWFCPRATCSQPMVSLPQAENPNRCPYCQLEVCVRCKIQHHKDLSYSEYRALPKDQKNPRDLAIHALAKNGNWKRCPQCRLFGQKTSGCNHITCPKW